MRQGKRRNLRCDHPLKNKNPLLSPKYRKWSRSRDPWSVSRRMQLSPSSASRSMLAPWTPIHKGSKLSWISHRSIQIRIRPRTMKSSLMPQQMMSSSRKRRRKRMTPSSNPCWWGGKNVPTPTPAQMSQAERLLVQAREGLDSAGKAKSLSQRFDSLYKSLNTQTLNGSLNAASAQAGRVGQTSRSDKLNPGRLSQTSHQELNTPSQTPLRSYHTASTTSKGNPSTQKHFTQHAPHMPVRHPEYYRLDDMIPSRHNTSAIEGHLEYLVFLYYC